MPSDKKDINKLIDRFIKKTLIIILILTNTNIWAQQAIDKKNKESFLGGYYSRLDALTCNGHDIVITSSCIQMEDDYVDLLITNLRRKL